MGQRVFLVHARDNNRQEHGWPLLQVIWIRLGAICEEIGASIGRLKGTQRSENRNNLKDFRRMREISGRITLHRSIMNEIF
jgi:hypothetical protein